MIIVIGLGLSVVVGIFTYGATLDTSTGMAVALGFFVLWCLVIWIKFLHVHRRLHTAGH